MRNAFGISLLLGFCLILAILTWGEYQGYSKLVSDWSQTRGCDWATNRYVAWYYSGAIPGYYRTNKAQKFLSELRKKRNLVVGIDYYVLMGVCRGMVPPVVLNKYGQGLIKGKVYKFKVTLMDNHIRWEDLN